MDNNLTTINQNAKLALIKSKNLLDITKKILDKKEIIQNFQFKPFLLEKGHEKSIKSLAISLDGKYIVSGSEDKTIKIWDLKSGECLKTLEGHEESIKYVAISPDGKYIVSGSEDKTIKIWDLKSGECLKTLKEYAISVAISPDGKYIISGSKTIKIWDLNSGKCLKTLATDWIKSIIISLDGKYIVGSDDDTIKIWDFKTGECLNTLKGHEYSVRSVAIHPDGKYIVSGSMDNTIKIWDFKSGVCLKTLEGHKNSVNSIAISPDGRYIVSGSYEIKIWDINSGVCLNTLEEFEGFVYSIAISPDGKYIVSGSGNNTIKNWDINSGKCINTIEKYVPPANIKKILFKENLLYIFNYKDTKIFNIKSAQYLDTISNQYISSVSSNEKYIVIRVNTNSINSTTIRIFCVHTNEFINEIKIYHKDNDEKIQKTAISSNGKYIVTSCKYYLKLWDIKSGECIDQERKSNVVSIEISSDNKYILIGNSGYHFSRININNMSLSTYLKCPEKDLEKLIATGRIATSTVGNYMVAGSLEHNTLRVWNLNQENCQKTLEGHTRSVSAVTISRDENYILSGSYDRTIKIWDIKNGVCLKTLYGHQYFLNNIIITSNMQYIISSDDGDIIKIWDFENGENIYTIDSLNNLSINKEGYFIGSDENIDKYLRVSESPLTQRKLTPEEINHFRKKGNFLEIEENTEKLKKYHEIFEIDIDEDEIPF